MNIYIIGVTTPSGKAFLDQSLSKYGSKYIHAYSRFENEYKFLDLTNQSTYRNLELDNDAYIVSFAPIWLFSKFLSCFLRINLNSNKNLRGVIVCSSSSVVTKRFSSNPFDKNLVLRLSQSEKLIEDTCKEFNLGCRIIRPTLIYGKVGKYSDRNISKLIRLIRLFPLIALPEKTGMRQPIHSNQLACVILSITNDCIDKETKYSKTITIGGDETLSYLDLLKSIKASLPLNDIGRRCLFIPIPNRFFFFLCAPIALISPKTYDALLRISSDLSGFTPSSEVLNTTPLKFPSGPITQD